MCHHSIFVMISNTVDMYRLYTEHLRFCVLIGHLSFDSTICPDVLAGKERCPPLLFCVVSAAQVAEKRTSMKWFNCVCVGGDVGGVCVCFFFNVDDEICIDPHMYCLVFTLTYPILTLAKVKRHIGQSQIFLRLNVVQNENNSLYTCTWYMCTLFYNLCKKKLSCVLTLLFHKG